MHSIAALLFFVLGQMPGPLSGRNFFPVATPPAYTLVQAGTATVDGTFTTSITPHASGHLLTVGFFAFNCGLGAAPPISDTAGNIWTTDKFFFDSAGSNNSYVLYHALTNGTAATTITIATSCFHGTVTPVEYSGVTTVDVSGAASNVAFSNPSMTLLTNHGGELVVGFGNLATPSSGFTARGGNANYIDGASTGTSTTFGSSDLYDPWSFVGVAYK
jgi:hypothetical protein